MNEFENIYYTQDYLSKRAEYAHKVFDEKFYEESEDTPLDRGYSLKTRHYCKSEKRPDGLTCSLSCSRSALVDRGGKEIFTFEVVDDHFSAGAAMIFTVNEEEYLFFKEDLYGYSVLRISDREVMHYIPAGIGGESFIITDSRFCGNISAALCGGCFWAAPYSVCLCDLSDPLREPTGMLLIDDIIDPSGELRSSGYFEDISFKDILGDKYIFEAERYIEKTEETLREEYAFKGDFLRSQLDKQVR